MGKESHLGIDQQADETNPGPESDRQTTGGTQGKTRCTDLHPKNMWRGKKMVKDYDLYSQIFHSKR